MITWPGVRETRTGIPIPKGLRNVIEATILVLEDYGWYIVLSISILMLFYWSVLKPLFEKYRIWWKSRRYVDMYENNPDLLTERLRAQEIRTVLWQEKYNKFAEDYARRQKIKLMRKNK